METDCASMVVGTVSAWFPDGTFNIAAVWAMVVVIENLTKSVNWSAGPDSASSVEFNPAMVTEGSHCFMDDCHF